MCTARTCSDTDPDDFLYVLLHSSTKIGSCASETLLIIRARFHRRRGQRTGWSAYMKLAH